MNKKESKILNLKILNNFYEFLYNNKDETKEQINFSNFNINLNDVTYNEKIMKNIKKYLKKTRLNHYQSLIRIIEEKW